MPLAVCAIEPGKDGSDVVRTARWLRASGFDVTFACLTAPPLERRLLIRLRGGTVHATIPDTASAQGAEALDALTLAIDTIRAAGLRLDVDVHVLGGRRKPALDRLAAGLAADLVVARDGGWALTDACPTLLVPPAGLAPRRPGPIVCGIGGGSTVTAGAAAHLALLLHRPLIVAHALDGRNRARRDDVQRRLDALTGRIHPRVRRQAVVVEGAMPRALDTLAEDVGADLVVLGRPRQRAPGPIGRLSTAAGVRTRTSQALVLVPRGPRSGRADSSTSSTCPSLSSTYEQFTSRTTTPAHPLSLPP